MPPPDPRGSPTDPAVSRGDAEETAAPAGGPAADATESGSQPDASPPAESPPPPPPPPVEETRFTGDWFGLRPKIEEFVHIDVFSNTYYGINMHGGADTNGAQRVSTSYDLLLDVHLERFGWFADSKIFMFAQGFYGRNVNDKVGSLGEPFDDADGEKSIYIDQLWYQQGFLDKKIQLRLGYLDQQSILDRNAYANSEDRQFMNTYLDNNNAIVPLTIGLGAAAFIQATDWLNLVIGAADGDGRQFDDGFHTTFHDGADFFGYFEMDFNLKFDTARGPLPGTYRFGVLYDPRTKAVYAPRSRVNRPPDEESDDVGCYLSFDQKLFREQPADDQGLGAFARYGFRHGNVNRVSQFWSTGLEYRGMLPRRDADVLGFGVYSVHASNDYQEYIDPDFTRETGFELYYMIQVTPWLTLTPDLQYIVNPGGLRDAEDAIVFGLRARMTL